MIPLDGRKLVQNIKSICKIRNLLPTAACIESGVGKSFIGDINRGRTPSVEKVQMLAAYLGVTTSELLGEVYIKQFTGEVLPETVQETQPKFSRSAEETALAYDRATPELQAAVRRVLGLPEEPLVSKDKAM